MAQKNKGTKIEKNIKKKLISKRKDIKSKLQLLKHGQREYENIFQPITKHLENIESELRKPSMKNSEKKPKRSTINKEELIKGELSDIQDYNYSDNDDDDDDNKNLEDDKSSIFSEPLPSTSTPVEFKTPKGTITNNSTSVTAPRLKKRKLSFSVANKPYDFRKLICSRVQDELREEDLKKQKEYEDQLNKSIRQKSFTDYYEQYDALPLKYIKKFIKDPSSEQSDGKFRVKFDKDIEMFSIGNKRIDFDGSDLIIAGKRFRGTSGLYGLLFNKTVPTVYTHDDAKNYADIIFRTSAARKHFNPNLKYITSKNTKFKKLIEPLINYESVGDQDEHENETISKQGQGMLMQVSDNPIDYRFWDDPNELVERLKLLFASQLAGNTGHTNEIISIIEELREAEIIK